MKVGSAVKYVRTHPEHSTLDAIIIRLDPVTKMATLVVAFPKGYHNFSDANWPDAFEEVHSVPHEPEGEFYHGWSEVEHSDDHFDDLYAQLKASEAASLAKDQLVADLEEKLKNQGLILAQLEAQIAAYDKGPDPNVPSDESAVEKPNGKKPKPIASGK